MPFVLLHAAYPYVRELSYLAAVYPNVHLDLGLAIPHVASDLPGVVRQALSLAPTSRVLFSSDASGLPELYWLAARWGRRALGTVLEELVRRATPRDRRGLRGGGGHPRPECGPSLRRAIWVVLSLASLPRR